MYCSFSIKELLKFIFDNFKNYYMIKYIVMSNNN